MIPQDPQERDVLAGEYVLGVLDDEAAREVAAAIPTNAGLRDAVAWWENKLHPLATLAEPMNPPAEIWDSIEARISRSAGRARLSQPGAAAWRWSTGAFAALAAGLLLYVAVVPRAPVRTGSPMFAVLQSSQTRSAGWIAVLGPAGLHLAELTTEKPPAAHAYELWGIEPHAARPVPLGVIPANGEMRVPALPKGVSAGATLAISIEPPGGSPTGLPTGPVVFTGVLRAT
jgi:anti-sigma-K factor RskA